MSPSRTLPAPLRPKWLIATLSIYSFMLLGSMATMSLGIGVVLIGVIIGFGSPKRFWAHFKAQFENKHVRRYLWAANFLTLACFLSLFFAVIMPLEVGGKTPEVSWVKDMWKAWYFYWPFMLVPALTAISPEGRKTVLKSWLGFASAFFVLGTINFFFGWPTSNPTTISGTYRVMNFFGSYLSFASIMIFPFFVLLDDWFQHKLQPRWITGGAILLGLLCLFGTFSRTLWAALPIGLVIYFCLRMPRKWAIATTVTIVLGAAVAINIPFVKDRAFSSNGISERTHLWKANIYFFKQRPLTGSGWHHNMKMSAGYMREFMPENKKPFIGHAHSNYFEWLGGLGMIGLLAGLMWCFTVAHQAYRVSYGFFAAWIVFFLNGITQVNFWEAKCIHSIVWAAAWVLVLSVKGKVPGYKLS